LISQAFQQWARSSINLVEDTMIEDMTPLFSQRRKLLVYQSRGDKGSVREGW